MELDGPEFNVLHEANARSVDAVTRRVAGMMTDWRVLLPALIFAIGIGALGWQQYYAAERFYREAIESDSRLDGIRERMAENSGNAIGRSDMFAEMQREIVKELTTKDRLLSWINEQGLEVPPEVLDEREKVEEE
jgi:hypothetical protein